MDSTATGKPKLTDVFTGEELKMDQSPSVLGRRYYIDDILIPATAWIPLYDKVERFLLVCDRCILSISLAKSFPGRRKVDYLGHQVSEPGLVAHKKDLGSLVKYSFSDVVPLYAVILGQYELLQQIYRRLCDVRISAIRVEGYRVR